MTDYDSMTNKEVDRAAAEMMPGGVTPPDWSPTDPDSNQAERYLFPMLWDCGLKIEIYSEKNILAASVIRDKSLTHWILIKVFGHVNQEIIHIKRQKSIKFDNVNLIKVIAFLKAMEKVKGDKNV